MITNFNTKEYSPSVLEIFNSKSSWFIRYGSIMLILVLAILLVASSFIKIQNNFNTKLVFYNNGSNNTAINNKIGTRNYLNKLSGLNNKNISGIYALIKFPLEISSNFKIGQNILLSLTNSYGKEKFIKATILRIEDAIFDANQIITIGFNSNNEIDAFYRKKIVKAKIRIKKISILNYLLSSITNNYNI